MVEQAELVASLKEMRDFTAACMRVIAKADQGHALMAEAKAAGVEHGVGIRADALILRAEGKVSTRTDADVEDDARAIREEAGR